MENAQYILVADYVPLANKGEEAIIRGIEDMLRDDRPVEIGIFDNVEEVTRRSNITIFPREWIFRLIGSPFKSRYHRVLKCILMSLQMRFGYYSILENMISSSEAKYQPLQEFFNQADYVLVGHDGVFYIESCGIVHLAKKAGKCTGILGSGSGIRWHARPYLSWIYRRTMNESDFCVFRDCYTYEAMKRISSDPNKLILAPDPAFAMQACNSVEALGVLGKYHSYRRARQSGKKIVGATVIERGGVYNYFMRKMDGIPKRQVHAEYVAEIFNSLIKERDVFVVFLPHSIERICSDAVVAGRVSKVMSCSSDNYMILNEDLGARLLKGVIGEFDFLVGERTHSLIASVSVGTAFMGLSNRFDRRTYGILGDMCRCENQIVDMNALDSKAASIKALELFDSRGAIRESLQETSSILIKQLADVSKIVKAAAKK